jgi:hypothetical protein
VCHGKPCVRGLRYPVETLLELLSSGMTTDQILADYEDLEREDLLAALALDPPPPAGEPMNFLVDAQLPRCMTAWLTSPGATSSTANCVPFHSTGERSVERISPH